ncbi:hypothetical protein C7N83_10460 [Neisseria iguanae]|uniref:Uncharacterized protein n=2 Tax=Neisseria iguanae TaxID=90242 RepID=A0A2P7TYC8_9NEIS|nr:hypothetical protein C7N83_10460 [Neisseria iguanae]
MPVIPCTIGWNSNVDSYIKNVSPEERMIDIKYCLNEDAEGIPDKYGYIFEPIRNKYNRSVHSEERVKKFDNCMKEKGYYYDHNYKG